jgi:hypothetical protein
MASPPDDRPRRTVTAQLVAIGGSPLRDDLDAAQRDAERVVRAVLEERETRGTDWSDPAARAHAAELAALRLRAVWGTSLLATLQRYLRGRADGA